MSTPDFSVAPLPSGDFRVYRAMSAPQQAEAQDLLRDARLFIGAYYRTTRLGSIDAFGHSVLRRLDNLLGDLK